jgi:hypothetical protein
MRLVKEHSYQKSGTQQSQQRILAKGGVLGWHNQNKPFELQRSEE